MLILVGRFPQQSVSPYITPLHRGEVTNSNPTVSWLDHTTLIMLADAAHREKAIKWLRATAVTLMGHGHTKRWSAEAYEMLAEVERRSGVRSGTWALYRAANAIGSIPVP